MRFDEQFIRKIVSEVSIFGTIPVDPIFTVDSRKMESANIFVALCGEQIDGHKFVADALSSGASAALVSTEKLQECQKVIEKNRLKNKTLIAVPDPRAALVSLATAWREQFSFPIVGITGSVGKTSTKEAIANLFEAAGLSFVASHGNQNTQIGVALNVLRLRSKHQVAVFEMGVNRRGEMALLAKIVKPTIGIITNVGHCHMEGLGSLQDIALEKRDIFKHFTEDDMGIVNGDQSVLAGVSYYHPVIKFGLKTTNQVQARKVRVVDARTHCVLKVYKEKFDVILSKPHAGAVTSALVVAALGHILSIPREKMIDSIQKPVVVKGRFESRALSIGKGVMISDCYNANPESMKAALIAFQQIETSATKVAILGDMLELGVNSPFWHRQIGRFFRKVPSLKKVILVGNLVQWIEKTLPIGTQVERVATWQDATKIISKIAQTKENMILVKGSNGVGLLNLVEQCTK